MQKRFYETNPIVDNSDLTQVPSTSGDTPKTCPSATRPARKTNPIWPQRRSERRCHRQQPQLAQVTHFHAQLGEPAGVDHWGAAG